MKLLPIVTLVIAGAALAACGTTRENRFNETAYADHNRTEYKRTTARWCIGSSGYDDPDVVYVRPAYRVVPVTPRAVIY